MKFSFVIPYNHKKSFYRNLRVVSRALMELNLYKRNKGLNASRPNINCKNVSLLQPDMIYPRRSLIDLYKSYHLLKTYVRVYKK